MGFHIGDPMFFSNATSISDCSRDSVKASSYCCATVACPKCSRSRVQLGRLSPSTRECTCRRWHAHHVASTDKSWATTARPSRTHPSAPCVCRVRISVTWNLKGLSATSDQRSEEQRQDSTFTPSSRMIPAWRLCHELGSCSPGDVPLKDASLHWQNRTGGFAGSWSVLSSAESWQKPSPSSSEIKYRRLPPLTSLLWKRGHEASVWPTHSAHCWSWTKPQVDGVAFDLISRRAMIQGLGWGCRLSACSTASHLSSCGRMSWGLWTTFHRAEWGGGQGDLLMPLFFSLGQHRALTSVAAVFHRGEQLFACHDDLYVTAQPDCVVDICYSLATHLWNQARIILHQGKNICLEYGRDLSMELPCVRCRQAPKSHHSRVAKKMLLLLGLVVLGFHWAGLSSPWPS